MSRINVMIEIVGDEWTDDFVVSQKYEVSIEGDQSESLAYAIDRLLTAVGAPRRFAILADVVTGHEPIVAAEEPFYDAAWAVLKHWRKSDEDLKKSMEKKCPNPS
jgi:hypothetical protein